MKKIININLSGRVIPIEDLAYEKLQAYIESLRRYFAKEEGRDEIINDIESRIAELMNDKIRKGSTAVTEDDVEEIFASMGRPEDFDAAENETISAGTQSKEQRFSSEQQEQTYTHTTTDTGRKRTRLYRDSDDKILGGVCAGMANYLNVDPAIVRILFAIITFGGFGIGFLVYILLWALLPSAPLNEVNTKKLFRNPNDRVLAGVASGLAAYFKKEVWVIRLIFGGPLLLNVLFSVLSWPFFHGGALFPNIALWSITSAFIFVYIVLWIVLPEAKSDFERMEMRGEKVDVNAIRQNVKERAKEFGEEVKSTAKNFSGKAKEFANTKGKDFASEVKNAAHRTGTGIGHIFAVLFKAFFLFIAGSITFGLFVGLMALIFGGVGLWPFKNFVLDGVAQNLFAWGTLLFFLVVPLIAFITWLIRRMMRTRSSNNYLGWTFGGLWALGWVCAALFAASLFNDFRSGGKKQTTPVAIQPANGTLIVRVSEPEISYGGSFWWMDADENGWDLTEDTLKLSNVKIRVDTSRDDNYYVSVTRYSVGSSRNDAENRAEHIVYNYTLKDSVLDLGSGYAISKDDKFRLQRVMVTIKVPIGKKIRFEESVDKLNRYNVRVTYNTRGWRENRQELDWDWDSYFGYDPDVDYIMNSERQLKRVDDIEKPKNDKEDKKKEKKKEMEPQPEQKTDTTQNNSNTVKESVDDLNDEVSGGKRKSITSIMSFSRSLFN